MYLISVYFDEKTSKILQRYIDEIALQTGNYFMTEHKVPPHMTIAALEARSVEVLRPTFVRVQDSVGEGDIQFASIGQLLPYVFYATPIFNDYLRNMNYKVCEEMTKLKDVTVNRFYQPDKWLPHVTLGKTLDKEQMRKAFLVMQERFQPFVAKVTTVGLAKVNPHEDVERFKI